eukprot:Skav201223  [mRNA]  locus=scaffold651:604664:609117:+ [translate_table: standard]
MALESSGAQMTVLGVGISTCRVRVAGSEAVLHIDAKWGSQMMIGMELVVKQFRVSWYENEIHFHAHAREGAVILLLANQARGEITAAEVFAGVAGWSPAVANAGVVTSLLIEKDELTAQCCAKTMKAPYMTAEEYVQKVLDRIELPPTVVLHDDITNAMVWVAMGLANVGMVVGSPPCPPWSGASYQYGMGLGCEEGMCFLATVLWTAEAMIPLLILENVGGLISHPDFTEIQRQASSKGLQLMLSGVFECQKILPLQRKRWLGTFVYKGVALCDAKVQAANAISFVQSVFHPVARSPSIDVVDVTHIHMSDQERQELQVSQDAIQAMMNRDFAPSWLTQKVGNTDERMLLRGRFVQLEDQHSGFMAKYGSQHTLDPQLLKTKGLHTKLWSDDGGFRYISPWEMMATMGYGAECVIPADITAAWRVAGNGITHAHAWLAIYKTHVMLDASSPFTPVEDVCKAVEKFRDQAIHLSTYNTVRDESFWFLVEIKDNNDEPDHKKRKCDEVQISATAAFEVTVPVGTCECTHKLQFRQIEDPRNVAAALMPHVGVVVVIQHAEGHWVMFVNGPKEGTVADFMQAGLPHAKANHFVWFRLQTNQAQWDSKISGEGILALTFSPVTLTMTLHEAHIDRTIQLLADVTWTVRSAIAYAAVEMKCNPDALCLHTNKGVMYDKEFLMEYDTVEFKMTFKACMPAYVSWDKSAIECKDPGIAVTDPSCHRVVARHPLRKVIRTCIFNDDCDVAGVIQVLFPDMFASMSWSVFRNGVEIEHTTKAIDVKWFEIQWNGFRPLPVTDVYHAVYETPADTPVNQLKNAMAGVKRAIKSPLKVRADELWCPKQCTVAQVAASFLLQTKANMSILCQIGPRVVDPNTCADDIDEKAVISFRICPLNGGGKGDMLKNKIKEMLVSRGVPENAVNERVQNLLSRVPADHIVKYKDSTDDDFWKKLKDDASDAKFRLILSAELKAFQLSQRKKKQHDTPAGSKPKVAKTKPFVVDAKAVKIDVTHFSAGGHPITLLETSRFGPDQTGLCLVTVEEANHCMNTVAKSCDPLALLIIGEGVHMYGKPFSLPAHLANGDPVVVQAVLKQFGDTPVVYDLKLPTIMVEPLASTVVEVCIYRELVSVWNDTAVPLHFLGIHIPALRGANLLATWSMRSWAKNKCVHYSQADHWHGYIRVADNLLTQVHCDSGAGHAAALGVVKLSEGYAIRAKREDADQLRSQLSPESAFVEQDVVKEGENMFVLKNVPQISKDELSGALVKMGWNAKAVKSQGVNKWLIAAREDSPSTHFIVNDSIVVIERMHRRDSGANIHMMAKEVKIDAVMDTKQQTMTVSTTSRFAEIRAQVEEQIAAAVEAKMAGANAKIEELQTTLEQVQQQNQAAQTALASDFNQMKEEQNFTRSKLAEVETSITASNQAIIAQMQQCFQQMEQKMTTMMAPDNDPEKRPRTAEMAKKDPFASKTS